MSITKKRKSNDNTKSSVSRKTKLIVKFNNSIKKKIKSMFFQETNGRGLSHAKSRTMWSEEMLSAILASYILHLISHPLKCHY